MQADFIKQIPEAKRLQHDLLRQSAAALVEVSLHGVRNAQAGIIRGHGPEATAQAQPSIDTSAERPELHVVAQKPVEVEPQTTQTDSIDAVEQPAQIPYEARNPLLHMVAQPTPVEQAVTEPTEQPPLNPVGTVDQPAAQETGQLNVADLQAQIRRIYDEMQNGGQANAA